MATLTVSVSDAMKSHVDQRVASGEFADAEDYLRELIRKDEARLEWLRSEIQKGLDSGVSPRSGEEIVARIVEKARLKCA